MRDKDENNLSVLYFELIINIFILRIENKREMQNSIPILYIFLAILFTFPISYNSDKNSEWCIENGLLIESYWAGAI